MSTLKQKEAVQTLLENTGIPVGTAMQRAGYAKPTIKNPKELTDSKGFKEEMAKYGLTEKLITSSLVQDIEAKPRRRVEELKLGANILKMIAESKTTPIPPRTELHLHLHKHQEIKNRYEEELEQALRDEKE